MHKLTANGPTTATGPEELHPAQYETIQELVQGWAAQHVDAEGKVVVHCCGARIDAEQVVIWREEEPLDVRFTPERALVLAALYVYSTYCQECARTGRQ